MSCRLQRLFLPFLGLMLSNYFTPEQKPSDAIGLLKTKSACNLIVLKVPKFLILIYINLAKGEKQSSC